LLLVDVDTVLLCLTEDFFAADKEGDQQDDQNRNGNPLAAFDPDHGQLAVVFGDHRAHEGHGATHQVVFISREPGRIGEGDMRQGRPHQDDEHIAIARPLPDPREEQQVKQRQQQQQALGRQEIIVPGREK